MTTTLKGCEGSASRPGRFLLPRKTRYPLYRRLGGHQGRSGQVRKISPPPTGIRSPDCPARSQSLYRLRYPAQKCRRQCNIQINLKGMRCEVQTGIVGLRIWIRAAHCLKVINRQNASSTRHFWLTAHIKVSINKSLHVVRYLVVG
jgi:hypothetical protein